jgi:hypothetical protein
MKILSGGQTGIDRAALDAAVEMGIDYGGWCPKGGWAEDFPQPPGLLAVYPHLRETTSADPLQRTELNVRGADRLLILVDASGLRKSIGTAAARDFAIELGKLQIVIDLDADDSLAQTLAWLGTGGQVATLCIGGPRESEAPGIYTKAQPFLCALMQRFHQ